MAYLCYSLTEAAQKLDLSETVLIRLSQFLRVPATAYDNLGRPVTYKGDLLLTDVDIAFFKQVKDRLLKGESLEDIKRRIVPDAIDVGSVPSEAALSASSGATPPPSPLPQGEGEQIYASAPAYQAVLANHTPPDLPDSRLLPRGEGAQGLQTRGADEGAQVSGSRLRSYQAGPDQLAQPLKNVESQQTLQTAADKSFQRYRAEHRTPPTQVFKNLVQETNPESTPQQSPKAPPPRPSTADMVARMASGSAEAVRPRAQQTPQAQQPPPARRPQAFSGQLQSGKLAQNHYTDQPWRPLIEAAVNQPRPLNTQLKTAAQLLKQKALRLQRAGI